MIRLSAFADEISADLDEQIAVLTGERIHFLELRGVWGANVLDLSDHQVEDVKRALDRAGIGVSAIGSPIGKVPVDSSFHESLHRFERALTVARAFDTSFVRIFSFYPPTPSDRYSLARFVSEQPPYNLLDRRIENELVPLAQRYGLALLAWSPLAGGVLAGRYNSRETVPAGSRLERNGRESLFGDRVTRRGVEVARGVSEIARARGLTASQLALLWCKDQPGVTSPIIGPRTMDQLQDALGVLNRDLEDDDRARLDELNPPGNAVSDFHNSNQWMKTRVRDDG